MNFTRLLSVFVLALCTLLTLGACDGNPADDYFRDMAEFEKEVGELLEGVHSIDSAREAAQELEAMMSRAQSLHEQHEEMEQSRYQGNDRLGEFEDTMNAFTEGLKYNAMVENQSSRLRKEPALWEHVGPPMRSLSQAIDPDKGHWIAVRRKDASR